MRTLSACLYRKKLRYRALQRMLAAAFFLFSCLLIIAVSIFNSSIASGESRMPRIITIQKGDTLWTLAKNNLPEGTDIRTYIEEICRHNNLSGSILIPGQKLELP